MHQVAVCIPPRHAKICRASMQGPKQTAVFWSNARQLPTALQVMKLGQLEITDGWMDGEKEVYTFTTRPNISIPQSLNRYLPGGELVYTGELLRVQCCTHVSSWDSCCCACCRPGGRLVYTG